MKKIAQILLSPRIGGAETLATSLDDEWRAHGVLARTIYLDCSNDGGGRLRRVRHLRRQLSDFQPDAVVAHSYLPALYARIAWGRRSPVHSVLHSASDDFGAPASRLLERALGSRTASVIAVSQEQQDLYAARFPRVPLTRIANGVSSSVHSRESFSHAPVRITTIARVAAQKRPEFWAAVAEEMRRRRPNVRFEWWGPLSGVDYLDHYVQIDGVGSQYMGETSNPGQVLEAADVLFHPSAREAHSIALLEGAVSGLPVVYADSISRPDDSPVWGWRYSATSVVAAVEMLEHVIGNWQQVAGDAVKFAPLARSRYGIGDVASNYLTWMKLTGQQK